MSLFRHLKCSRFGLRFALLIVFIVSSLLILAGPAYGQSSPFSDITSASGTQILPSIGTVDTGIVIGSIGAVGPCPSSPVDLRDDGVLIQKISVTPPGATTLKLTQVTLTNLGSSAAGDLGTINGFAGNLVLYDFTSKKCIRVATVSSTPVGAPFNASVSFSPAFDLTGITAIGIAIQAKTANLWSANMIGDTIQLRTQIGYQSIQGGVISNFSAILNSSVLFTLGLGAFSELTLNPTEIVPVNTNPTVTQILQFAVNAANEGHLNPIVGQTYGLALRDACVLNTGSVQPAGDIDSLTLSSTVTTPVANISGIGTDLAAGTICAGAGPMAFGSFNSSGGLGISLQTPPASIINSVIPASSLTTAFTLSIQMRSTAGLGQTLRLQTTLILAPVVRATSGVQTAPNTVPGGANPRASMSKTLTIESGQAHLGIQDAFVILRPPGQDFPPTTETTLVASNFKSPGVQSFSATLSYDPVMVQIAGGGCSGIRGVAQTESSGIFHRAQISNCQIDNPHGRASFFVEVKGTPPTGGPARLATIVLQAGVQANASSSTLITLAVSNVNSNSVKVTATPGLVRFLRGGDLNADGQVGIEDAVQLASAILAALAAGCGNDALAAAGLTVPQLEAADIAFPFAKPVSSPPIFARSDFTCANITSADVAAIARRALLTSGASAPSAALAPLLSLNALRVESLTLSPGELRSGTSADLAVRGYGIAGLELRFYDLSGRLALNEHTDGSRLRFRLTDASGRPLARGVYLYLVTVRGFDGQIIQSEVRKLIVR